MICDQDYFSTIVEMVSMATSAFGMLIGSYLSDRWIYMPVTSWCYISFYVHFTYSKTSVTIYNLFALFCLTVYSMLVVWHFYSVKACFTLINLHYCLYKATKLNYKINVIVNSDSQLCTSKRGQLRIDISLVIKKTIHIQKHFSIF